MPEKSWYKLARKIVKAGELPIPINKPLIELIKTLINEEQLNFLLKFKKPSLTFQQIKKQTELDEDYIEKMLIDLMDVGIITGIPSRNTGVMVYRIVAFLPGMLEFTLMRGEKGEKQKKLANIWKQFFDDLNTSTQKNYDQLINAFKNAPPFDRVVPVEEEIEFQQDSVFPYEEVKKIVDKQEIIGVAYCYCRHLKDLLDDPCKLDAPRQNCLTFGRTAQFCVDHGFAKQITKQEALRILKEAEDIGLVHKAIHNHQDPNDEEVGLCNCCKCCCGNFVNFYKGTSPTSTYSSYLALVKEEMCLGCGACVNICPMEAIHLDDAIAVIMKERCIGCGLCAHHCPEHAITLERTGIRSVFIPPPKMETN
ncbi:MAG: 4Fe-4S dicluster domain-containing protein [Promethearchaeota archaeon]|nr:MAG: 4Fe-4S dicluster domain-containing protein [Candidatus Lokiarchaeota archaeon]